VSEMSLPPIAALRTPPPGEPGDGV
jgi:hypothetical protein